jgi:hypothetical protein
MSPSGSITANVGGVVPGVVFHWDPAPPQKIAEEQVEAWRTSLVGLLPEAIDTYSRVGPVMLSHHAAWFLRLGKLTGDTLLIDAAANAVLGRYANFPGYYFTSLATTVYQQPDYPLHPYRDITYNAIFYNHIWPHIALVQDYLVAEAFAKSDGQVRFYSAYAPGYAFLTSKVYGQMGGEVFGDKGVQLWLPPKALKASTTALNHLFGTGKNDTYLLLSNTRREPVADEIILNAAVVPLDAEKNYPLTIYCPGLPPKQAEMRNGRIPIQVAGHGFAAIKIHGLTVKRQIAIAPGNQQSKTNSIDYFRVAHPSPVGSVTGMIFQF